MLETVKATIANSPFISFDQYFLQYVFEIQDKNIDNEISFLLRNNNMNIPTIMRMLNIEGDRIDDKCI